MTLKAVFFWSALCLAACQKKSSSDTKGSSGPSKSSNVQNSGKAKSSSSGGLGDLEALFGGLGGGAKGGASAPGEEDLPGSGSTSGVDWARRFGDPHLAFQLYEVEKNYLQYENRDKDPARYSDIFQCPGDGFIVGFRSLYDKEHGDRLMHPYCQYLEDAQGKPLKRQNCEVVKAIPAGADAKEFTCKASKVLAGVRASWDEVQRDRSYDFMCCEFVDASGTKMDFAQGPDVQSGETTHICERYPGSPTAQANRFLGTLDNVCQGAVLDMQTGQGTPAPTAIRSVISSYMENDFEGKKQKDRIWNFDCCMLGAQGAAK